MTETSDRAQLNGLRTPKSAAVAGIIFAVLFTSCVVLMITALPADVASPWVHGRTRIRTALVLAPFAGIAFLWFIAVVRDGFGHLEDRFFTTVFLGSGLLFMAMTFISMAIAGAILDESGRPDASSNVIYFGREAMVHINTAFGLRMGGVFMISLGTIWLRTQLMPRWLVILTYLIALTLLLAIGFSLWVVLTFPVWVFLISVHILLTHRHPSWAHVPDR
ncbi:MAG: hypothetical protein WAW17_08380 [Rhodococcus sp. (in: high G+C Gram-positive bacteria)]|uniref:hypothetical protein n=1 Tax=Rhodococcus sp. TaxID=1831 RepID=UPI003BAF55C2